MTTSTPSAIAPHIIGRPNGLVPAVVEALVDRIVAGEFATGGSPFPREAELVADYGVSRTVVREALRVLEARGLIEIRQGRATEALGADRWDLLDPRIISALVRSDPGYDVVEELVDVRAGLEAEMARVATQRNAEEFLPELDVAWAALEAHQDDAQRYLDLDRAFHDVIMHASGNRFGRRIVHEVFVWTRRSTHLEVPLSQVTRAHREHSRIRRLILAGDADAAAASMREHIIESWKATRARIEGEDDTRDQPAR